jgi:type III pantothenate kinase
VLRHGVGRRSAERASMNVTPPYWLLLDAGNSALKWVVMTPDGRLGPGHGTLRNAAPAEMTAGVAEQLRSRAAVPIAAAYGCGVATPALMRALAQGVQQTYGVAVEWFESQPLFEHDGVRLRNGYRDPSQLGVDRWHALLAARAAHPGRSLVVVNAGTATTVDGVTMDGIFVGGAIAPGVRMMFDALARGTANLPYSRGTLVSYPDNTEDAIATGVIGAQLGLVERFVRNFRADHGDPQVILTGGYAQSFAPFIGLGTSLPSVIREENLVLRGVLLRARSLLPEITAPTIISSDPDLE